MASKLLLVPGALAVETSYLPPAHGKISTVMRVIKMVFFIAVLLFLVLMGVYNRANVNFQLPPLLHQEIRQPAALMYFAFFAVGLITGTLAFLGQGKSSAGKSKSGAS